MAFASVHIPSMPRHPSEPNNFGKGKHGWLLEQSHGKHASAISDKYDNRDRRTVRVNPALSDPIERPTNPDDVHYGRNSYSGYHYGPKYTSKYRNNMHYQPMY